MRRELAAEVVDAAFEDLGEDASYTPPDGSPAVSPIRIIFANPDIVVADGDDAAGIIVRDVTIEVRASQGSPEQGGVFVPGTIVDAVFVPGIVSFRIKEDLTVKDDRRLVFVCPCERV